MTVFYASILTKRVISFAWKSNKISQDSVEKKKYQWLTSIIWSINFKGTFRYPCCLKAFTELSDLAEHY